MYRLITRTVAGIHLHCKSNTYLVGHERYSGTLNLPKAWLLHLPQIGGGNVLTSVCLFICCLLLAYVRKLRLWIKEESFKFWKVRVRVRVRIADKDT